MEKVKIKNIETQIAEEEKITNSSIDIVETKLEQNTQKEQELIKEENKSGIKKFFAKINHVTEFISKRTVLVLIIMAAILLASMVTFMFARLDSMVTYDLFSRLFTLLAILLISVCVGYSTVVFQTVTGAKILTPGVIGLENIYMFLNALLILIFPATSALFIFSIHGNFLVSVIIMLAFSALIFVPLLTKGSKGVYILLLVGIIISTFFSSITSYMQFIMNPEQFNEFQARMFATFANPDILLMIISAAVAVVAIATAPSGRRLDVIALGRENAIGLGVNHKICSLRVLVAVAALVAVSTVIVGPVMFLGLIAANLSYQFIKSYKHKYLIPAAILICAISLIVAEIFIRHVFSINLNVAVVINFFGGIYFIFLLLRNRKKDK